MAQNFRHSEILTIARDAGKVTVKGLASHFNVTAQTIRRDLAELCDVGQLTRVHGRAMIPSGVIALGYEDRRSLASVEKDAIARMLAEQIPDGMSIFMNIGTTAEAVARALLKHRVPWASVSERSERGVASSGSSLPRKGSAPLDSSATARRPRQPPR